MAALKIEDLRISNIIRKSADDNRILTLHDLIQWQQDVITLIDKINFLNGGADYVKQVDGANAVVSGLLDIGYGGQATNEGVYVINGTVNIDGFQMGSWPKSDYNRIIIKPGETDTMTVNLVPAGSVTSNGKYMGNIYQTAGTFDLYGPNGDYMICERRISDGFNVISVIPFVAA